MAEAIPTPQAAPQDPGPQGQAPEATMAPDQAQARIKALQADPTFSGQYLRKEANAVAEMGKLFAMAYPDPQDGSQASEAPQAADPTNALAYGPQSPSEYRFEVTPGVERDPEMEAATRELFHKAEIPAPIGNWVAGLWDKAVAKGFPSEQQRAQDHQECGALLQKMWGGEFNRNLEMARGEVARIAKIDPSIVEKLEISGLGNHPHLIATLANMAAARQVRGQRR